MVFGLQFHSCEGASATFHKDVKKYDSRTRSTHMEMCEYNNILYKSITQLHSIIELIDTAFQPMDVIFQLSGLALSGVSLWILLYFSFQLMLLYF